MLGHQLEGAEMVEYSKCGRSFGESEKEEIQQIVKDRYETSRCLISHEVCEALDWYGKNGKPKEWVCRELLTCMDRDGVIELPPPEGKTPCGIIWWAPIITSAIVARWDGFSNTSHGVRMCRLPAWDGPERH